MLPLVVKAPTRRSTRPHNTMRPSGSVCGRRVSSIVRSTSTSFESIRFNVDVGDENLYVDCEVPPSIASAEVRIKHHRSGRQLVRVENPISGMWIQGTFDLDLAECLATWDSGVQADQIDGVVRDNVQGQESKLVTRKKWWQFWRQPSSGSRSPSSSKNKSKTGAVKFLREKKTVEYGNPTVRRFYKAPTKAIALEYLKDQTITKQQYFLVIETPEGPVAKDRMGIFSP